MPNISRQPNLTLATMNEIIVAAVLWRKPRQFVAKLQQILRLITSIQLLDPLSLTFVTVLTVPGEGVWTVDTTDGVAIFTPDPDFTGDPTPVDYRVQVVGTDVWIGSTVTITYLDTPAGAPPVVVVPEAPPSGFGTPPAPAPTPQAPSPNPLPDGPIAYTGSNTALLAILGMLVFWAGGTLMIVSREIRRREDSALGDES